MCAYDSTLTAQTKTLPELEEKLNIDAGIVSDWCRVNKMAAYATETKVMLKTNWQKMGFNSRNKNM